jgi:cephalosporin hydroxylase
MTIEKFTKMFNTFGPSQHRFELFSLLNFIESRKMELKTILEIGVFRGGTFKFWRELIESGGLLIGVDSGERGLIPEVSKTKIENEHIVIGDSTSDTVIRQAKNLLNGNTIDILFVDGCHDYDFVKSDFENYAPLVKKDGLVIFHDIVGPAVGKVWGEVKENYDYQGVVEFYGKEKPCGIGAILK